MMSWIRWKYVVPLLIFIAALLVFFIFFFDPLLARGLEKAGSALNGAKVDVSGLKTKIIPGRLSIGNLQVANPDAPMQNRVEAGPLVFQLSLSDLFSRKVIINEASLKGLEFNTPRKSSGAMPKAKTKAKEEPGPAARLAEKYKERFKLNLDGLKGTAKERIDIDPKDLEITKQANALKDNAEKLPSVWDSRIKELNAEARLKKVEADLNGIKADLDSLNKLKQAKSDLDALKKDVQNAKSASTSELTSIKTGVTGLSQAKKQDLDNLMSRLNLDFASPDRIIEGIVGPIVLQRFETVFRYVQIGRKYMSSKKASAAQALPVREREQGVDVIFPTPAAPPAFWLMKAILEGNYESVHATGGMSNLTSDPARVGQPFKLDLNGKSGKQVYDIGVVMDHVTDVFKDSLSLQATGLDVNKMLAGNADNPGFSAGSGSAEMQLSLLGEDNIGGQIKFVMSSVKVDEATLMSKVGIDNPASTSVDDKLKIDFAKRLVRAIEGMKEVAVNAQVTGTWKDPSLKISSNLSSAFASVLKDTLGSAVAEQRQQLEGKLNQILADKQKDVQSSISGLDGKLGAFGGLESKIQELLAKSTGVGLSGSSSEKGLKVPALKGLFNK